MLIITMNWMLSLTFIFLSHPLSLGFILLMQSIMISLIIGYFYLNFWFSYILFLVMIGGMLVMFIYMTSIASNEKFSIPKYMMMMIISIMTIFMLMFFIDNYYSNILNYMNINMSQSSTNIILSPLSKFFNAPNMQMMIILMIYLFMTLIATVKIVGKNFGTLRQK
uniref:NADH-ubiquinone oxidoreductase chain 6 n=1 Tax=Curculionoidea sp. 2 KM-2017 TaxID=2219403 RepID=A0A346RKN1_9CUCU|nr:NADH dehydrogenase subunit 6 [Curculionoidea sp. 2 KM-2017]